MPTVCPQCGTLFQVPSRFIGRTAECMKCQATYVLSAADPQTHAELVISRPHEFWLKAGDVISGPFTKQKLVERLSEASEGVPLFAGLSESGPWYSAQGRIASTTPEPLPEPVLRPVRKRKRKKLSRTRSPDEFQIPWDDEDDRQGIVRLENPRQRRPRKPKKKTPRTATRSATPADGRLLALLLECSHIQSCLITALLFGAVLACVKDLFILSAEVFIPFQHSGPSLVESDLAVAGSSMAIAAILLLVPAYLLYDQEGRWLSYSGCLLAGGLIAAVISAADGDINSHTLAVRVLLMLPGAAGAGLSVLAAFQWRDPRTILPLMSGAVVTLIAAGVYLASAPSLGLRCHIREIPVILEVSEMTVLSLLAAGLQPGWLYFLMKKITSAHFDATTLAHVTQQGWTGLASLAAAILIAGFCAVDGGLTWFSTAIGAASAALSGWGLMILSTQNLIMSACLPED